MAPGLTPSGYLFMVRLSQYKEKHTKGLSKEEKFEMFAKAEYDYKHASTHNKIVLDQQAKEFNKAMQKGGKG